MSGFSNAVVGGIGKLVRKWIQSPDYVPETSGWTVNQDGTVEFNDGVFRGTIEASNIVLIGASGEILVYSGPPAAGNLILAVSGAAGTDSFGNVYAKGLTIAAISAADPYHSAIQFYNPNYGVNQAIIKNLDASGVPNGLGYFEIIGPSPDGQKPAEASLSWQTAPSGHSELDLFADTIQIAPPTPSANPQVIMGIPIRIGSGLPGGYHYEEWDISPNSDLAVPDNTVTTIKTKVSLTKLLSDYGAKFVASTGVFTCPIDGIYKINYMVALSAWVAGSRFLMRLTVNNIVMGVLDNSPPSPVGQVSTEVFLSTGDTVQFLIYQHEGSSVNITNTGTRSFLTIRRVL